MASGYKCITPIQLGNILFLLERGTVSNHDMRVYFACFVLVAVREAARRFQKSKGEAPKKLARYRIHEIERLTDLPGRAVRGSLAQLSAAGALRYSEGEIVATTEPLEGPLDILDMIRCGRSAKRPIPIPRSMLRFLASNRKEALAKTVIAYLVRGLSLSRNGIMKNKGTIKVSWIQRVFSLSERSVRYARTALVNMGWIERDTGSFQRKLNRDGSYFVINLDWAWNHERCADANISSTSTPFVNREKSAPVPAPLGAKICTDFAPPYKDRKTSYEVKNQKTQTTEPNGFSKENGIPNLRSIVPADLWSFGRLETLYVQAVRAKWVRESEATALNFISAAVRAREKGTDPPKLFVSIIRRGLWRHITQAQEDRARLALVKFRAEDPLRFRASAA